ELAAKYQGIWYFTRPEMLPHLERALAELDEKTRRQFAVMALADEAVKEAASPPPPPTQCPQNQPRRYEDTTWHQPRQFWPPSRVSEAFLMAWLGHENEDQQPSCEDQKPSETKSADHPCDG